jgi:hypothetical protein
MHRQNKDFAVRSHSPDLLQHFDTRQVRHGKVQHQDIGNDSAHEQIHELKPVAGLPDDPEFPAVFQQGPHSAPEHWVIIGQDYVLRYFHDQAFPILRDTRSSPNSALKTIALITH